MRDSIREALKSNLINDETLAYIYALNFAREHNPDDPKIYEAIRETLHSIRMIECVLKQKESAGETEDRKEDSGSEEQDQEHPKVNISDSVINHLEKQRILMVPLDMGTGVVADAGKLRNFQYRLKGAENSRQMYALNEHRIGLYFRAESRTPAAGKIEEPGIPVTINNTSLTFLDTNFRGANIDLFYPGLAHQLSGERVRGYTGILHLNLTFKNCWVKNMNLLFWHYIFNFPGTITIIFEDCEDFDEVYFPYLRKESDGCRYYPDLERFSGKIGALAGSKFTQYIRNILHFSAIYKYEHLR
ncbi:hypothetical protein P0082_09060 [Candidatus Haliotispira prima]|uniref:Uncharacterized protein n=1 Tax=Candidatus Haliotispira prima TaxID=3034016 RepID=A0ABY8MFC2_9SPIO|nr:hypothetical protein P0082_09060 [Candidatus Haliotispira prima]